MGTAAMPRRSIPTPSVARCLQSEIELVEGGASLSVLEENKHDWLQRLLRSELVDGYSGSAAHFRKGVQPHACHELAVIL